MDRRHHGGTEPGRLRTGAVMRSFKANPYTWILAALLAYFAWSSHQAGQDLTRVCRVTGPDLIDSQSLTGDQRRALAICLAHKD